MSRKKIYYPEFQITKGLKTNGSEWMFENGVEYIGYYHKYTTGEVYSESEYDSIKSKKLIPIDNVAGNSNFSTFDDYQIKNNQLNLLSYKQPIYTKRNITDFEKEQGWIERYFVKKRNDINSKVVEITLDEYETLNKINTGIDGFLYKGLMLRWKIAGERQNVSEINKKSMLSNINNFNGLQNILVDFLEYYQK